MVIEHISHLIVFTKESFKNISETELYFKEILLIIRHGLFEVKSLCAQQINFLAKQCLKIGKQKYSRHSWLLT